MSSHCFMCVSNRPNSIWSHFKQSFTFSRMLKTLKTQPFEKEIKNNGQDLNSGLTDSSDVSLSSVLERSFFSNVTFRPRLLLWIVHFLTKQQQSPKQKRQSSGCQTFKWYLLISGQQLMLAQLPKTESVPWLETNDTQRRDKPKSLCLKIKHKK